MGAKLTDVASLGAVDSTTARELGAVVTREDGRYVARRPDVEVTSQGESVESALANLREALALYFEHE
jgi:predicted RNase H-like HicB family nuclease